MNRRTFAVLTILVSTTPLLRAAERVLIPIAINVDGANGSRFVTEATVYNNASAAAPYPPTMLSVPTVCYRSPCDVAESNTMGPRETRAIPSIGTPGLIVSKEGGGFVYYNVRVHDTSRNAQSAGVEIPVVRESQFHGLISIENVPGDARFRSRLRVYALDAHSFGTIGLMDPADDTVLAHLEFSADRPANATAEQPFYFETALPALERNYRVDLAVVSLRAGGPVGNVWAFVTTTNNETQEITISSPSEPQY
jgi:hypothetical protein